VRLEANPASIRSRRRHGAAPLHHLLARMLESQGRSEQAARYRRLADELDPPPPPLPVSSLPVSSRRIAVALLPPRASGAKRERIPTDWPAGVAATTLEQRLQLRLPDAKVEFTSPGTVAEGRRWLTERAARGALSFRVERTYCGDTVKDGRFALAWLRVAGEVPGEPSAGPDERREVLHNPRGPEDCRAEALARAVERAFKHSVVRRALANPPDGRPSAWSRLAIRSLFPGIGERIVEELAAGRAKLAVGRVDLAREAFERAVRIDPEDPVVLTYLHETNATIAMTDELIRRRDPAADLLEDRGVLDPRFSPAQRAAAHARLAAERKRREELFAGRSLRLEDARAPEGDQLDALRPGVIRDAAAFGPATARERTGGDVVVRVALASDGSEAARYFFAAGESVPILRAEDTNRDGRADRWIAYQERTRREVWEDTRGSGVPDVHLVFGADGIPLERIEIDGNGNGRTDRVIRYSDGSLRSEAYDTDGDGVLDRFDRFDSQGDVAIREEDLDGDGQVDMTSSYRGGRLLDRTSRDPVPAGG